MSKTYTGSRTISAVFVPEQTSRKGHWDFEQDRWVETDETYVSCRAHWEAQVDGRTYYGWTAKTEADALTKAAREATKMDIDEAIYPIAKAAAADCDGMVPGEGQTAADFFVGQRVAVWSHNRRRAGIVEKVGKVNVTVAVVVASSGNLCRATAKFAEAVILEPATPEEPATMAATFEQVSRDQCDANGQDTVVIKWHGTNQYQTILAADLRTLQANFNEFVPEVVR